MKAVAKLAAAQKAEADKTSVEKTAAAAGITADVKAAENVSAEEKSVQRFVHLIKTFDAKQKQAYLEIVASANASKNIKEATLTIFGLVVRRPLVKFLRDMGESASPQPYHSVEMKRGGKASPTAQAVTWPCQLTCTHLHSSELVSYVRFLSHA